MSIPHVIESTFVLGRRGRTNDAKRSRDASAHRVTEPSPRMPRIARHMALAWHIESLVREGAVSSYAEVARLGHVSRSRLCQILSLLHLAPELQEQALFLTRPAHGREPLPLRKVLAIAAVLDWDEQRRRWRKLQRTTKAHR